MKKYTLTPEHKAQFEPWKDKWVASAMSTKPMDQEEKALCREAVKGLYRAANLEPPPDHRIVFVPSPFVARFAGGFAAAIWYMRKNKKRNFARNATNATDAATNATYDATRAATYDATRAATDAATYAATDAATRAATDAATYDATDAATYDATDAATRAATLAATSAATSAATDDATDAATYDATSAATYDATDAATRAATQSDKWYKLDVDGLVKLSNILGVGLFGLNCAQLGWKMWNGGNQWSGWVSFISFFRHIVKLKIDYSKWQHYETLAEHSSYRIMHEKFCIISDRPKTLRVNARNQPHCEDGPFCEWRDGTALFSINGVRVPEWVVMKSKNDITAKEVFSLTNAEQRAQAIKKVGIGALLSELESKTIDEWREYQLVTIKIENRRIGPYLSMRNPSTGEIHCEGVGDAEKYENIDPTIKTVKAALAWRNNVPEYIEPEILT